MIDRVLGHYRVLERIGAGGMGEVYRARDERLRREVALKVLPRAETSDPEARARLLREARLASALNHPHICTVHEVDEHDGELFIAMELVQGLPLSEAIPPGGLAAADVLRYGAQIADALAHAHAHRVVHRDLKSANVMVTPEGRVKVLDFGLARPLVGDTSSTLGLSSRLTQTGAILGTPHYMAPEVLQGGLADERSDLWALGVVLHEMASGTPPFEGGTSFEVAAAILHAEPAALPETVPPGLRAVIGRCLEKEPGERYQQAGDVRTALEALAAGQSSGAVASPKPAARPRVSRSALGLGAAIAVVAVGATLLLGQYRGCPGTEAIRSLAVLPLANLSGDPDQEYFADGMTDELIGLLAQVGALRVISRTSVMGYKGTRKPLAQIARELGVDALVDGSVSWGKNRVRIRAGLARARTGESIWTEALERNAGDVLALQADVARAIVNQIRVHLDAPERRRLTETRPLDPEVYQAYLKGRYAWNRYTLEGFQEARRQFQLAIDRDPGYAPAWAGLADAAYGMSSIFVAPDVALPEARAAAEKALGLDSTLAEAHVSIGIVKMVFDWDWAGAMRSFDRAIALKPSSADAHWWRGHVYLVRGEFAEALAEQDKALALDPLSPWYGVTKGWRLILARRYRDAEASLREGVELHPGDYSFHVFLGLALSHQGKHAEAIGEIERGVSMDENNDDLAQLAYAYGAAGRTADAKRAIARLLGRREKGFVPAGDLAFAYAGLKDERETLRWLEAAVEDRSESLVLTHVDPAFDWIRPHPRFQAVLRRIGLAQG